MVVRMTSGGFLSTEAVVATLACVALLAVVSALALAPLDRLARHHIAAFLVPGGHLGRGGPRHRADQAHHMRAHTI